MKKVCARCNKPRPPEAYPTTRARVCQRCTAARIKATSRNTSLRKLYGLTLEEYERLREFQQGRCAICQRAPRYRLAVDHDHKTTEVRGLLCKLCNQHILPSARDDPKVLRRAAEYLEHPPAQDVFGGFCER